MPDEINSQTWDTVSADAPDIPAAPVADAPVAPLPEPPSPAEAATLEPAAQLEAEPAARESESPTVTPPEEEVKDEDIEEGDAPEILALPTGSSSRKWARRQFHDAAPTRTFLDFDKSITEFGDELYQRSESRYREHVDDLVTRHKEYASHKLFGVSYEDAKNRLQPNGQPTPATVRGTTPDTPSLSLTEAQLADLSNEEVAQRLSEFQSAQEAEKAALRSEFEKKVDALQKQFDAVNGKVTTQEQQAFQNTVTEKQNELYNNVWNVVEEGIRNSGLEAAPTDPPKIASLKRAAVRLLDKHNIEAAFDAVPENEKLVRYVFEATSRGEFQNAFREEDNLKVRARAAFESVKTSPEVQAIFGEIEAYANQSKGNSRAVNPIPSAPGSSVGITVSTPKTWDEAEKMAATA